jgi:uncharacterized membrane protein
VTTIRLLMPIVVAVGLGPLVPALIFCVLAVSTNLVDQTGGQPIADLFKMFGVYVIFAYLEGGALALLAGLLVSIWMIWHPPNIVVAVVAALASVGLFRLAADIGLSPSGANLVRNSLALTLVLAVISAGACWLLTRRFVSAIDA